MFTTVSGLDFLDGLSLSINRGHHDPLSLQCLSLTPNLASSNISHVSFFIPGKYDPVLDY